MVEYDFYDLFNSCNHVDISRVFFTIYNSFF